MQSLKTPLPRLFDLLYELPSGLLALVLVGVCKGLVGSHLARVRLAGVRDSDADAYTAQSGLRV